MKLNKISSQRILKIQILLLAFTYPAPCSMERKLIEKNTLTFQKSMLKLGYMGNQLKSLVASPYFEV